MGRERYVFSHKETHTTCFKYHDQLFVMLTKSQLGSSIFNTLFKVRLFKVRSGVNKTKWLKLIHMEIITS